MLFHGDEGIRPAPFVFGICSDNAVEDTEDQAEEERQHLIPDAKSCSTCGVKFEDLAEQRQHFKMDWHRLEFTQSNPDYKLLVTMIFMFQIQSKTETRWR